MDVKKIIANHEEKGLGLKSKMKGEEGNARVEIERRMVRLNTCFVEQILPGIFEVENDLSQAGYWNEVKIGQSTSSSSGKPNIKSVAFYFFPEKTHSLSYRQDAGKRVYQAEIRASGDLRKINFSIQFPQRLARRIEIDTIELKVEEIDKSVVDDFLEKFIKGALEAYTSDHLLR